MAYFKCTVKSETEGPDGFMRKVSEEYVLNAVSYTEAETRMNKRFEGQNMDNMEIDIAKYKVETYFKGEADRFFKVTADYIELDEKTGDEKRRPRSYLLTARNVADAVKVFDENMRDSVVDMEVTAVKMEKRIIEYLDE